MFTGVRPQQKFVLLPSLFIGKKTKATTCANVLAGAQYLSNLARVRHVTMDLNLHTIIVTSSVLYTLQK